MRKKATLDCSECGFVGTVSYSPDEYNRQDIAYCPVCGADVSDQDEEDLE